MGGVEDEEPPSKRVKVSSEQLVDISDRTLPRDPASCSLSGSMALSLDFQGDTEVVGTKGVIKKVEFVRIITEALYSLGYKKTVAHLEEESGIELRSPVINSFVEQILDGKWDESVATLQQIGLVDEKVVKLASFEIWEQKFFELLDKGEVTDALTTLRSKISRLYIKEERLHELACTMLHPQQGLTGESGQVMVRAKPRAELLNELQRLLPPTVMIPEKRLIHLVEQALNVQLAACRFHNSVVGEISLLTDHRCGSDHIPSQTVQVLRDHKNEVWFLQFSHNGNYLASSSADCSVIIWEVKSDGSVRLKHLCSGHHKPVSFMSWSPDDDQLLSCGGEEVVRRWDVESGKCIHIYEKNGLGLISCGWAPDGKKIFCGLTDKSISMWDLEGNELESIKGHKTLKMSDLGITSDGKHVVSVCKENMIGLFGWQSKAERLIEEDQIITSFVLSTDGKHVLVSLWNQEIHLWSIEGAVKLIAKYKGHKRTRFVVRSCFGGLDQAFVASGSEDSQVYIWHRGSGELIAKLSGHSGTVNCVSWNPANPHMLASASDDHTIRIWGLKQLNTQQHGAVTNGVNRQS